MKEYINLINSLKYYNSILIYRCQKKIKLDLKN